MVPTPRACDALVARREMSITRSNAVESLDKHQTVLAPSEDASAWCLAAAIGTGPATCKSSVPRVHLSPERGLTLVRVMERKRPSPVDSWAQGVGSTVELCLLPRKQILNVQCRWMQVRGGGGGWGIVSGGGVERVSRGAAGGFPAPFDGALLAPHVS